MQLKYEVIATHEHHGLNTQGCRILLAINRDISDDENYFISQKCAEILDLIRKNTLLSDPKFIQELKDEKEYLLECFGSRDIYVKEIPNEYSPSSYYNPWFIVTTNKGPIKIGWRKRVINIDWSESDVTQLGRELFTGEQYTTGTYDYESVRYIHAAGYEKAKEYLNKILSS
jgi:hypothetical protein